MPEGRIIKKKIVDDYRFNNVSVEARLLFLEMITHLDCEGRLQADPRWVNKKFFSFNDYSPEQVDGWLNELWGQKKRGRGLIQRYEVEDRQYLWMPGMWGEQSLSWQKYTYPTETQSIIPPPPEKDPDIKEKLAYIKDYKTKHPDKAELVGAKLTKMELSQAKPPTVKTSKVESSKVETFKVDEILDPKLAKLVEYYQSNIGMLSPSLFDRLKDDYDEYGYELFIKAIGEAIDYKQRSLNYIEAILKRWKAEGQGVEPKGKPEDDIPGLKIKE